jgi:hypothetical protein
MGRPDLALGVPPCVSRKPGDAPEFSFELSFLSQKGRQLVQRSCEALLPGLVTVRLC